MMKYSEPLTPAERLQPLSKMSVRELMDRRDRLIVDLCHLAYLNPREVVCGLITGMYVMAERVHEGEEIEKTYNRILQKIRDFIVDNEE